MFTSNITSHHGVILVPQGPAMSRQCPASVRTSVFFSNLLAASTMSFSSWPHVIRVKKPEKVSGRTKYNIYIYIYNKGGCSTMLPHVENVNFAWENHKRTGPGDNQDIAFPCFPQVPNVKISTAHLYQTYVGHSLGKKEGPLGFLWRFQLAVLLKGSR